MHEFFCKSKPAPVLPDQIENSNLLIRTKVISPIVDDLLRDVIPSDGNSKASHVPIHKFASIFSKTPKCDTKIDEIPEVEIFDQPAQNINVGTNKEISKKLQFCGKS